MIKRTPSERRAIAEARKRKAARDAELLNRVRIVKQLMKSGMPRYQACAKAKVSVITFTEHEHRV